jgi:hypothetical protein
MERRLANQFPMRRGFFSSLLPCVLALVFATSSPQTRQAGAADVAVQYVQISTRTALTMNGQTISNAMDAKKLMGQAMGKSLVAGMAQSLVGSVIQQVLGAINPILGMAAQLIAAKVQQKLSQGMAHQMKMGVTEVQSEAVTTTVSTLRRRIDDGNITILVQCDLGRLVTIDNTAHTYFVKTFDELAAEGAAAVATDASGKDAQSTDCKTPKAAVEHSSDDQTDTIAGMTAHHKTETTIYTFPPGCMPKPDKANGVPDMSQQKWTTERWYATSDVPNQCALPVAGNDRDSQAASTVEIPLRIIRKVDMGQMQSQLEAQLKSMPPNPYMQSSGVLDVISHLSDMLTFTTETQSVKQVTYDASSFDLPAGYTQTEGGATPPPALRQSS